MSVHRRDYNLNSWCFAFAATSLSTTMIKKLLTITLLMNASMVGGGAILAGSAVAACYGLQCWMGDVPRFLRHCGWNYRPGRMGGKAGFGACWMFGCPRCLYGRLHRRRTGHCRRPHPLIQQCRLGRTFNQDDIDGQSNTTNKIIKAINNQSKGRNNRLVFWSLYSYWCTVEGMRLAYKCLIIRSILIIFETERVDPFPSSSHR
jgi:hypothetical protein